ncbi:hypothetical protein D3C71_437780 [compost metagenome]
MERTVNIKSEAIEAAQEMARQQGVEISDGQLMLVLGAFMQASNFSINATEAVDDRHSDPEYAARMKLCSGHAALVSIRKHIAEVEKEAGALPSEEGDWQYKILFDYLFDGNESVATEIRDILKEMDRSLVDYYDPDTTYKEDSLAYIGAIDDTIESLRKEIAGEVDPEPTPWWQQR